MEQARTLWLQRGALAVFPRDPAQVVVTSTTAAYRRLALSQVSLGDTALEIGSCYGDTTEILRLHTGGRALGVDISHRMIAESRRRFPECRFEVFDALTENLRSLSGTDSWSCEDVITAVFVDIGGERASDAVDNDCKSSAGIPAELGRCEVKVLGVACQQPSCASGYGM